MLLVTDTLFIENFPMVHQGDSHISDNCTEVIQREGNYFFRGYKAVGLILVEKKISPADCKINFVVLSDLILAKHQYRQYSTDDLRYIRTHQLGPINYH